MLVNYGRLFYPLNRMGWMKDTSLQYSAIECVEYPSSALLLFLPCLALRGRCLHRTTPVPCSSFFYFAATTSSRRFSEWFAFKYTKIEPGWGVGVGEGPGLNS